MLRDDQKRRDCKIVWPEGGLAKAIDSAIDFSGPLRALEADGFIGAVSVTGPVRQNASHAAVAADAACIGCRPGQPHIRVSGVSAAGDPVEADELGGDLRLFRAMWVCEWSPRCLQRWEDCGEVGADGLEMPLEGWFVHDSRSGCNPWWCSRFWSGLAVADPRHALALAHASEG